MWSKKIDQELDRLVDGINNNWLATRPFLEALNRLSREMLGEAWGADRIVDVGET